MEEINKFNVFDDKKSRKLLYTRNLTPGKTFFGEELVREGIKSENPQWLEPVYFKGLKILPGLRGSEYFLSLNACIDFEDRQIHRQIMNKYVKTYSPEDTEKRRIISKAMKNELGFFWYYASQDKDVGSICFAEHAPYHENIAEVIKEFKNKLPKALDIFLERFYIDDKPKVEKLLREGVERIINSK